MKATVSVPDELFGRMERLAAQTKRSRSQLFREALREYLARHVPEEVTEAMNRVCDGSEERQDSFQSVASQRMLKRSEW